MSEPTVGVYVDRFYEMDPQFEDVIYGTDLREGMFVLLESTTMRGDPERAFGDDTYAKYEFARVREVNRWCQVTMLEFVPRSGYEPLVKFMAIYADGTKKPRTYSSHWAWIVKREAA
jgi:hypothetical protein